jgi:D-ribose pyranase
MLKTGILNPQINSLLGRIRHTNTLVIADRGFPYWTDLEIIDISLVDDIPCVLDVVRAILQNFSSGQFFMAEEFLTHNSAMTAQRFADACGASQITYEPHIAFKRRVPSAIGLIRTADTTPFANVIVESA